MRASFESDEQTRYRKKSKRKVAPKAKHKHNFVPCVFEFNGVQLDRAKGFIPKPDVGLGYYCPICGKIGNGDIDQWFQWVPMRPGSKAGRSEYTDLAKTELDPTTRTLPTFWLDDRWGQKYVTLPEVAY